MNIKHILNVLTPRAGSDLVRAQPITLASIRNAIDATLLEHDVRVLAFFKEDESPVPEWMATLETSF